MTRPLTVSCACPIAQKPPAGPAAARVRPQGRPGSPAANHWPFMWWPLGWALGSLNWWGALSLISLATAPGVLVVMVV